MTIKHLYPTQRPSLDLNFARTKRLDPRVTFTRGSTATYVGNDGLIKTAVDHEPRFDHDPDTGESLGLLIEESRTNLLSYSGSIGPGKDGFFTNATTVTENADTAPDNTVTATRISSDANYCGLQKNITSGVEYTFSCYIKTLTLTSVTLATQTTPSIAKNVTVSPGEWTRVDLTFTATAAGNQQLRFFNLWLNEDVLIWGAQLEEGSFPTSYIPTSGSTVTRAADVASLTNTNVYDTDSFTILNDPYGAAGGGSTLSIVGGGQTPVKRTTVYNQELSQSQINTLVKKDDEFWRWRILGSSFALPSFLTDGQVTVDWGDGTIETLTTSEHTFSDGSGYHDIGFRLDSGTYFRSNINNNATHKDKVIALGPAPESMKLHGSNSFYGCANLEAFDATVDVVTNISRAWDNCSSLTSFPLIDTSSLTSFYYGWNVCTSLTSFPLLDTSNVTELIGPWRQCSSLTSFPLIDTSNVTNFYNAWEGCSSLTSFPAIDISSGTSFARAWRLCSSLTSFPLLDTSSGTNFNTTWDACSSLTSFPLLDTSNGIAFQETWRTCSGLTSFPLIDTSSGENFGSAWQNCSSLTSFPLIDTSSGTNFYQAWRNCSSLTSFPAGFFDSWTGTPVNNCFVVAWDNCTSLTATSVENILNSIDTSGQSAPASGVDITIDYDAGTGTPSVSTAVTNLKSRGWTITLNGVAQ